MMDFNASPDELQRAHERRLQIRAQIREHNNTRPRCSGCGNDMLVFEESDFITAEQYDAPGWEWIKHNDLRPNDLLCFWCSVSVVQIENQFVWGHA